jgi:hypothetical protein
MFRSFYCLQFTEDHNVIQNTCFRHKIGIIVFEHPVALVDRLTYICIYTYVYLYVKLWPPEHM